MEFVAPRTGMEWSHSATMIVTLATHASEWLTLGESEWRTRLQ